MPDMVNTSVAYTEVELDLTGPDISSLVIGTGASKVNVTVLKLNITPDEAATDVAQMKIWGDVDPTYDSDIQTTEEGSTWITYANTKNIKLSEEDGTKVIHCKLRDDVYNEGEAKTATTILSTELPTVAITTGPTPNKISKIATKDTSEFQFQASADFTEYKVCVVADTGAIESAGTVIQTTNGSQNMSGTGTFAKEDQISCVIKGADLEAASPGDGKKIIKIFVKDTQGVWSA